MRTSRGERLRTTLRAVSACALILAGGALAAHHDGWAVVPLATALGALAAPLRGAARARRALERERRVLRTAIESSDDAFLLLDAEGRIEFTNERLVAGLCQGHPPVGTFSELALARFDGEGLEPLQAALASRSSWRGQLTARAVDEAGAPLAFEARVTPIAGSPGADGGSLVTFRDITSALRAERAVQLAAEGDRAKMAVAWAMSAEAPLDGRCSAALAAIFQLEGFGAESRGAVFTRGARAGELELLSYCGDFSEALVQSARVHAGQGLAGASVERGELKVCDGCLEQQQPGQSHVCDTEHPHGHYLVPLLERPGTALGLLVLTTGPAPIRDAARLESLTLIGELFTTAIVRDAAERSLVEASRRAEEANRAKSDFLATMSHEIRTPMNGVLGFTQLLLASELAPEQRESAELISNSAEALLALLNDILDFSKIEAGKLQVDPRPTAIVDAAREAVGLLKATAVRKGLGLTFEAQPQLPAALLLDSMRFRQVLLNLVGNAVKFTPTGAVQVRLTREDEGGQDQLVVHVQDSGIGIPQKVLPTLFGKFVQADASTSRRFGGTGLGLAISKRLVELMGGTMGAESTEGVGSDFWFRLPIISAVLAKPAARERASTVVARHRRVLLAEDNAINQRLATRVLEKLGAEVVVAVNGLEAVAELKASPFDLVLMDCQMPELDGFDATRAIRAFELERAAPRVPIIAVTANAFAEDIERCLAAGMDAVLTKPFKLDELEQTLGTVDAARARLAS